MPLRAARVGRVGVIGHPVAKTAVVARAVSPGPSPVAKTAVVAAAVTPGQGGARPPGIVPGPGGRPAPAHLTGAGASASFGPPRLVGGENAAQSSADTGQA